MYFGRRRKGGRGGKYGERSRFLLIWGGGLGLARKRKESKSSRHLGRTGGMCSHVEGG
jgi:hypothetical protein